MKIFKVSSWSEEIIEEEADKESKSCYWIRGKKRNKLSDYDCYFPTREDAKGAIIKRHERVIEAARQTISLATARLEKARAL